MQDETVRIDQLKAFLKKSGYDGYEVTPLAGDASRRVYSRLVGGDTRLILADADPELGEEPGAFGAVTKLLRDFGLKAPEIFHADYERGFIVQEDFGAVTLSEALKKDASLEKKYYGDAIDLLAELAKKTPPNVIQYSGGTHKLHPYNTARYMSESRIFLSWYIPELTKRPAPEFMTDEFTAIMRGLLAPVENSRAKVLVLRDYHAENIMILNNGKTGVAALGLIDYQDALVGNPAYDVVSLLKDARRDVSPALEAEMIERYLSACPQIIREDFLRDYVILGAQRNIKILGIFARLYARAKKTTYLNYIPRVWGYLERDLKDPRLSSLSAWFEKNLPQDLRAMTIGAAA